ncbi:hypothetical protein ACSQ67_011426 [Phaseolus vulgaris]
MNFSGKGFRVKASSMNGGVGGSNLQLVPYSENKKVCPFASVNSSVENPWEGTSKCTRRAREPASLPIRRRATRRGFGSSLALTCPTIVNEDVRGGEIVAPLRIVENGAIGAAVTPLRILENGANDVEAPLGIDETSASGAEIHDMSMSLVGCGWKTKGRREETKRRTKS